jgi:hypothetical protein
MHVQTFSVAATTDASGDATVYLGPMNAMLSHMRYVKTDFADGVDFTITDEATGATIWTESNVNASATRAPRMATHTTAGVASVYAAADGVLAPIPVSGRIKIVVASGGNAKTGTFHAVTY